MQNLAFHASARRDVRITLYPHIVFRLQLRQRLSQALISEGGGAAELCAIQYRMKAYVTFRAGFVRSAEHDGTAVGTGQLPAVRNARCPTVHLRPQCVHAVVRRADRVTAQSGESRRARYGKSHPYRGGILLAEAARFELADGCPSPHFECGSL